MYDVEKMKEVDEYCDKALVDGNKTYGDDYLMKPLGTDLIEEVRDIINYGRLFLLRVKEIEVVMNTGGSIIELLKTKDTKDLIHLGIEIDNILDGRG